MSLHTQDCSCYKCHFDRTHPSPHAALLEVLAAIVFPDPDPTPWCIGCGALTQAKCTCGPMRACDSGPYMD